MQESEANKQNDIRDNIGETSSYIQLLTLVAEQEHCSSK